MIIDSHAHIFPHMGSAGGYDAAATRLRYLQKGMCHPNQPVRRKRDNAIVTEPTLWDTKDPGPGGLLDVNFRVTANGRFEWTKDGEDYYIVFQPVNNKEMSSPSEFIVNQMDYAGIDVAVLQHTHIYGMLNEIHPEAARQHPGRFIPLCQADEWKFDQQSEIDRLEHSVKELGNRGLYITSEGWFMNNFAKGADDPSYFPFWDAVQSLGIPVFWEINGCPLPTKENYLKQVQRVQNLAKRFPRTRGVITHAFPIRLFTEPNGRITIPEETMQLAENTNWTFELLFPIQIGRFYEYPYYETLPVVRYVYERLGAEKLCWGSDMPNVERTCTYRQAMEHIYNHTPYIPASHKDLIFGDNLARMFGIK